MGGCVQVMDCVVDRGKAGEVYTVGSNIEQANFKTVKMILRCLNKPERLIQFVDDRPGHDFRYSVDITKIKKLGWQPFVKVRGFRGLLGLSLPVQ